MTKDEALKLALEFIENSECGTADLEARIKEALALPQRTWVGLTDEERKNIMIECESTGDWAWELKAAQAIEAKLKQKNTWQDGNCKHCTDGCPACDARRQSNVLP
jgi:hypothetical protein